MIAILKFEFFKNKCDFTSTKIIDSAKKKVRATLLKLNWTDYDFNIDVKINDNRF